MTLFKSKKTHKLEKETCKLNINELIVRIYEVLHHNNKQKITQQKDKATDMNRHGQREEAQVVNKHTKVCSI